MSYIIKPMQTVDEIDRKGYVHYKSWQETYVGLIDSEYLYNMTEEKCKAIAHKWTDNILVAKDGDKVIGFVGYGKYRDDSLIDIRRKTACVKNYHAAAQKNFYKSICFILA